MMDDIERIKFNDNLEKDFINSKRKYEATKKALEKRISDIEKNKVKATFKADTSKLERKIENLKKLYEKASTRKERLELQDEIDKLENKIIKSS
jgi:hypothetical protein